MASGPSPNQNAPIAPISMGDYDDDDLMNVASAPVPVVTGDLVRELTDYKEHAMDGANEDEDEFHSSQQRRSPPPRAPSRRGGGAAESISSVTMEHYNSANPDNSVINREDLGTTQPPSHRYLTDSDDEMGAGANVEQPEDDFKAAASVSSDRKGSKKWLLIGLIILLVVVGAAVGGVCGSGNCSSSSSSSPSSGDSPLPPGTTASPTASPATPSVSTLSDIRERGTLRCGVATAAGFSTIENGERVGFDVDLVRSACGKHD